MSIKETTCHAERLPAVLHPKQTRSMTETDI